MARGSQDESLPPSSFPMSSPTFWDEAARVTTHAEEENGSTPMAGEAGEVRSVLTGQHGRRLEAERESSSLAKEELKEIPARSDERSSGTTLSYLPNRADPQADLSSHGYLAGAEYAPNRFGDIGDYMRKKEIKVQTQNRDIAMADPAAALLPQIFKDLSFYINGNTHPPMEELRKMILQRGGEVRPVLRSKGFVKYIIAPMLTQMKFKQFQHYKVVREAWIVESCKEGKLLDWTRWKLQVQGGWEEEGRKGLEGFFKGEPTQRPKREREESDSEEEEEIEEQVEFKPERAAKRLQVGKPSPTISSARSQVARAEPVTPARPILPIPPGVAAMAPAETSIVEGDENPAKEKTPQKPPRPEGMFEFYSTKSSNEDAARLLKDQEWRLKNTAERGNEGGFIDGYYQNSRLHHLSTWKAELRVLVAAAQRQSEENSLKTPSSTSISPLSLSTSVLPTRAQTTAGTGDKVIFHVDFDCFFVSCGLATRPQLRGKPAVVCHSTGGRQEGSTSEIASASYEARAKGVRNGMSLGRARTLVGEDLETIPYEFETYKKFSLAFYTVLMGYADELQAVSVDEALIDVTGAVAARDAAPEEADRVSEVDVDDEEAPSRRPRDAAVEIAEKIRGDIRKETGCEVSIGISHNVLLSKLATRRAKPAGVYHLATAEIPAFLAPLDVEDFPSVGYSIRSKVEEKFGTTIAGDLMEHSKGAFRGVLGPKTGEMVWGYLRGLDDRKLEPHKERKSISAEMNYGIRFRNDEQAEVCVRDLAAEVAKRMKQVNAKGRLLTLKLMKRHPEAPLEPPKFLGHGWCETFNKSSAVGTKGGASTDDPEILGVEAVKLLRTLGLDPVELRGVGIQMTKLDGDRPEREAGQGVLSFAAGKKREQSGMIKDEQQDSHTTETADSIEAKVIEPPLDDPLDSDALAAIPAEISKSGPPTAIGNSTAGPSRLIAPAASSDGIDPDFLAALPPELQREVKQEHARTRASRKAALAEPKPLVPLPKKPAPPPSPKKATIPAAAASAPAIKTISIPPTRLKDTVGSMVPHWSRLDHTINKEGRHSAAHISKQLRPKIKTQLKAGQIADLALYSAWNKAKADGTPPPDAAPLHTSVQAREVLDLTDSPVKNDKGKRKRDDTVSPTRGAPEVVEVEEVLEDSTEKIGLFFVRDLHELGIDPAFFAELPEDMQTEVVAEERRKHRQRSLLHRPADTSRIRAREREAGMSRGASVGRTLSLSPGRSRGGSLPPVRDIKRPTVVRPEARRPAMLNATKLPDVLDTITKWIESRGGKGPAERDARKVEAYLVSLVDPGAGLGGVEAALECLRWMRVILREKWHQDKVDGVVAHDPWDVPERDPNDEKRRLAGEAWWATWRRFVDRISRRSEQTIGAPLRM